MSENGPSSNQDNVVVSAMQIARYRQMTGQERLGIGLGMWEFARDFIAESIRNERPGISAKELAHELRKRMRT